VRRDDGAGKPVASVETDSIASCRSVDFNLSSVRREATGRVFGGDTALEGKAAGCNMVLCQAKLLERSTGSNLDLRCDNVDACNLLGDGMLNLTVCPLADAQVPCMPAKWFLTTATPHDGILTCAG
jgi:hypothetical protein